jgi:hypothetical protein
MRTTKEIVERLFDMLHGLAGMGCLIEEERAELEALAIEWYAQNSEE